MATSTLGTFRADLYHRLDILQLRVPLLREHIEDIKIIAESVLPSLTPEGQGLKLTKGSLQALQSYDWPGNVRQLIKLLKRSLFLDVAIPNRKKVKEWGVSEALCMDVSPCG